MLISTHLGEFCSSANKPLQRNLSTHTSHWLAVRVKNSICYTGNIAPLPNGEHADGRFCEPRIIHSFRNRNPDSLISEVVVSRHKNRTNDPTCTDLVGLTLYSKMGSMEKACSAFRDAKRFGMFYDVTHYNTLDRKPRIGITYSSYFPETTAKLSNVIAELKQAAGLPAGMAQNILDFTDPLVSDEVLQARYPQDDAYKPKYLLNHLTSLPWSETDVIYDPICDETLPKKAHPIIDVVLNNDHDTLRSMLTEHPEWTNLKSPQGDSVHRLASYVGDYQTFKIVFDTRQSMGYVSDNQRDQQRHYGRELHEYRAAFNRREKMVQWTTEFGSLEKLEKLIAEDAIPELDKKRANGIQSEWAYWTRDKMEAIEDTWDDKKESDYNSSGEVNLARSKYIQQNNKEKFRQNLREPALQRSSFHQACVDGDIQIVQQELEKDSELLDSRDPRGFSAIMLASANGHLNILKLLLKHGASLETYRIDNVYVYKLVNQVRCPQTLEFILKNTHDTIDFSEVLYRAIEANDSKWLETLLYYTDHLPERNNLSFWENLLTYGHHHTAEIQAVFLRYYERTFGDPLFMGPFDDSRSDADQDLRVSTRPYIGERTKQLLFDYRQRVIGTQNAREVCPRFAQGPQLRGNQLVETFVTPVLNGRDVVGQKNIVTIQKPICSLTAAERAEMFKLFSENFSIAPTYQDQFTQQSYFAAAITDVPGRQVMAQLCYDEAEATLVSFLTTELASSYHPEVGSFKFFHGKLAGNHSAYGRMNFTNLGFRNAMVEQSIDPDIPVFAFMKAIPPGFALSFMPFHVDFYPKKAMPEAFVEHLVTMADDRLEGEQIPCKLEVENCRWPRIATLPLQYYRQRVDTSMQMAMPICFQFKSDTVAKYSELIERNGVGSAEMDRYKAVYEQWKRGFKMTNKL